MRLARLIIVVSMIQALPSCRTISEGDSSSVADAVGSDAYSKDGQKFVCEARSQNVFCPAVVIPVDSEFKKSCEELGGNSVQCGACQDQQACSIDITKRYAFTKDGQRFACLDRSTNVFCPAVAIPVDSDFKKTCENRGGNSVFCGECQDQQACSVDVTKRYAFDKDGQRFVCYDVSPTVFCPAVVIPVDTDFQKSCTERGGDSMQCGVCQDQQACSVDVKKN